MMDRPLFKAELDHPPTQLDFCSVLAQQSAIHMTLRTKSSVCLDVTDAPVTRHALWEHALQAHHHFAILGEPSQIRRPRRAYSPK